MLYVSVWQVKPPAKEGRSAFRLTVIRGCDLPQGSFRNRAKALRNLLKKLIHKYKHKKKINAKNILAYILVLIF